MDIQTVDFVNVGDRVAALGCPAPVGITLLPQNFETAASADEFILASEAATVTSLFRQGGLPLSKIQRPSGATPFAQNNAFEWLAPTLFISATYLSQNPDYVSIAINILSEYLTDFFKGVQGEKKVKLEIVIEQNVERSCKKVSYSGPVEGMGEIARVVKELSDE
jgi:hypothetical protein